MHHQSHRLRVADSDKSWDSFDRKKAEMAEEASNKNTEKERSVINLDIFSFVWCEWEVPNLNFVIDSIPQSSNGAVFSDFLPCTEELCSILRVAIWSACFRYQESGRSRDQRTAMIENLLYIWVLVSSLTLKVMVLTCFNILENHLCFTFYIILPCL